MAKNKRSVVEDEIGIVQKDIGIEAELKTKDEISKEEFIIDEVFEIDECGIMPLMSINDRITKTVKDFGKCKVVVDELKVLTRSRFLREYKESTLKMGDTFYFDRIHITTKNYQYVSWDAGNGKKSYVLFKNLDTGVSPVVRIEV